VIKAKSKDRKSIARIKAKGRGDYKREKDDKERVSRLDCEREAASTEHTKWDSFNPRAPINSFYFANMHKLLQSELNVYKQQLRD